MEELVLYYAESSTLALNSFNWQLTAADDLDIIAHASMLACLRPQGNTTASNSTLSSTVTMRPVFDVHDVVVDRQDESPKSDDDDIPVSTNSQLVNTDDQSVSQVQIQKTSNIKRKTLTCHVDETADTRPNKYLRTKTMNHMALDAVLSS